MKEIHKIVLNNIFLLVIFLFNIFYGLKILEFFYSSNAYIDLIGLYFILILSAILYFYPLFKFKSKKNDFIQDLKYFNYSILTYYIGITYLMWGLGGSLSVAYLMILIFLFGGFIFTLILTYISQKYLK